MHDVSPAAHAVGVAKTPALDAAPTLQEKPLPPPPVAGVGIEKGVGAGVGVVPPPPVPAAEPSPAGTTRQRREKLKAPTPKVALAPARRSAVRSASMSSLLLAIERPLAEAEPVGWRFG